MRAAARDAESARRPRRARARSGRPRRCADAPSGTSRGPDWTIVIGTPNRANTWASSQPVGPPPRTSRLRGSSRVSVACSLVHGLGLGQALDRRHLRGRADRDDDVRGLELVGRARRAVTSTTPRPDDPAVAPVDDARRRPRAPCTCEAVVGLGGAGGAVDHVVAPLRGALPRVVGAVARGRRRRGAATSRARSRCAGTTRRTSRLSTTATDAPSARALCAAASPAGPAPMTTKSNVGIEVMVPGRAGVAAGVSARWRRASYSRTAAVIETLRLSATPSIGRRDRRDPVAGPGVREARRLASRGRARPGRGGRPRCTATRAADAGGEHARCRARRARRGPPRSCRPRPARAKIVPSEARIAFGLNRSVRGSATITASAPAASADRSTAPRLPGFSTALERRRRAGPAGGRSAASDWSGIATTATSPSARSP